MSGDLTLDMDHFGNPALPQEPGSPVIDSGLGEIKFMTPGELKEIVAAAQLHIDGATIAGAQPELCGTYGKLGQPSVLYSQVGGDHYKKLGIYQPWMVAAACMTAAELRGYMKGTVLAYLMREGDKGADLDIEKIAHTIQLWQEVRKDK